MAFGNRICKPLFTGSIGNQVTPMFLGILPDLRQENPNSWNGKTGKMEPWENCNGMVWFRGVKIWSKSREVALPGHPHRFNGGDLGNITSFLFPC